MKSYKIILSIVGFALTSITFGQLLSQSDGSILFYTVAYNSTNNRLEHHLSEFPEKRAYGDKFEAPLAARTYFGPMETDMVVESWMTTPFKSNYYEAEPFIESWMTTPFESNYYEVVPFIELWMTVPFYSEDKMEVEEWMTTSWM